MRAIFPGRFQPFHNGHLYAIKKILDENDSIMIIIENAGESFTFKNPMTAGERFEMIFETIMELNLKSEDLIIVPMENIPNNAEWVHHLKIMLPKFDICYSNNDLVKILMENDDIKVKRIEFKSREIYQGSEIRKRIAMDLEWKNSVPENVYEFITKNKIDKRIKNLYRMIE
ncbi:MAG: nicotinamide-nucleotide adenylyltransferase [Thermoplasmata archaeon]|nr:nicotinamide-nucleotide adenylyltransferase [Thermoplasmata archaeon]